MSANRRLYEDVEIALGDQNYRIPAMLFGTGRGMEQIRKITISKNKNHYDDDLAQAYVAFILEAIPARQLTDFTWDVEGYYLDLTTQRLLLSKQTQLRYLRKNCSAPDFNAILDERPSILSNLTSLQHVHIEIEEWGDYAIGHHMLKSSDNLKELTISMLKVLENDVYVTSQKAMQLLLNPSPDECAISLPVLEHLQLTGFDLLQTTASWTKLVDFHALKFFNLWDCEQIDTMLERVRRLFICQDVSTTPITKALSAICTQSVEPPRLRELWISRDQSTEQCQQLKFIDGLLLSFSGLTSLFIELRYTGGELSGQQINHLAITNHGYTLRTLCIGIQKSDDALGFDLRQTGLYFSKEEFFHLCLACRHLRHLSLPLYSIDNEDPHEFAKLVDKTIVSLNIPVPSSRSLFRIPSIDWNLMVDFEHRKVSSSCLR